jgi:hypothetical protein
MLHIIASPREIPVTTTNRVPSALLFHLLLSLHIISLANASRLLCLWPHCSCFKVVSSPCSTLLFPDNSHVIKPNEDPIAQIVPRIRMMSIYIAMCVPIPFAHWTTLSPRHVVHFPCLSQSGRLWTLRPFVPPLPVGKTPKR